MSKFVADAVMDAALAEIADNGNQLHLVSQAPAVYADVGTYSLGMVVLTPGDGNGAYTIQAGLASGRRLSLAQQTVEATDDGTATHAVIIDSVEEDILQFTSAPSYNMVTGVNQTVPGYDVWEIEDPT